MNRQDLVTIRRMIGSAVRRNDPEQVDNIRRDFYIYEATALALVAGGNANVIINIEADSDFLLQKFAYQADIAAAAFTFNTKPLPNVTIQLIDSGSGRQLMQNPTPVTSFMGDGQLPFILPNPRKFLANSTIQVAFANFDAAVTYNIRLAFIGYKIYVTP